MSRLSTLLKILEITSKPTPQNLEATCSYLSSIATEPRKHNFANKTNVLFNVPDSLPLETAKLRKPVARNIFHYECFCIQKRKSLQPYDCQFFS